MIYRLRFLSSFQGETFLKWKTQSVYGSYRDLNVQKIFITLDDKTISDKISLLKA